MDKMLREDKLYQIIDQFNERKINLQSFIQYSQTKYIHFMMVIGNNVIELQLLEV